MLVRSPGSSGDVCCLPLHGRWVGDEAVPRVFKWFLYDGLGNAT